MPFPSVKAQVCRPTQSLATAKFWQSAQSEGGNFQCPHQTGMEATLGPSVEPVLEAVAVVVLLRCGVKSCGESH